MSFSDRLYINKVMTKEPENIEEWLRRFIEVILKENSDCNSKERQKQHGKKGKEAVADKKK